MISGFARKTHRIALAALKCSSLPEGDNIKAIVKNLIAHMDDFNDWDNPQYYNIETLKLLSANHGLRSLAEVVR